MDFLIDLLDFYHYILQDVALPAGVPVNSLTADAVVKEGFIASALAGTSFGGTITALLASWGVKIGFSGGALTFTAPLSLSLCCAAVGGAALGQELFYATQCVQLVSSFSPSPGILSQEKEILLPQVPQVDPKTMLAITVEEHGNQSELLNNPHDVILFYQPPSSQKSNKCRKKDKAHRRSHGNKPPKDAEDPGGVEDVAKVTTAHRVYEFIKKKWRECKSACHDCTVLSQKQASNVVTARGRYSEQIIWITLNMGLLKELISALVLLMANRLCIIQCLGMVMWVDVSGRVMAKSLR